MSQPRNMPVVNVVLTPELHAQLTERAAASGLKKSEIVRQALAAHLAKPKRSK